MILRNFYFLFFVGAILASLYIYGFSYYNGYTNPLYYVINYGINSKEILYLIVPAVILWFIFIMISEPDKKTNYGNAKWAKTKDIKKMKLFADTGIIYGMWGKKFIRSNQPLSALIAAPPGTGKTVSVVIPNLLSCNNSMIINDVKNELWEITANHRKKYQKVVRLAFAEQDSDSWNPFSEMPNNINDKMVYIDRIASVIYVTTGKTNDDHWVYMSRTLLKLMIIKLLIQDTNVIISISNTRSDLLKTASIRKDLSIFSEQLTQDIEFGITEANNLTQYFIEQTNLMVQLSDKEFSSVLSSTTNKLEIFNDPIIAKNTQKSDFKFSELRNNKVSIYLCSKPKDLERVKIITALFIELAANEFLSDKPNDEQIITFLIDEFPRMSKLNALVKLPAVSRGQKVNVILIAQDYDQIKEVYHETGLNEIISTTAYKIVFTQNNYNTMKRVSDLIGKYTEERENITKQEGKFFGSKSRQKSKEGKNLILPENIGALKQDEVIIIAQGYNTTPILAKPAYYKNIATMKKLVAT